jgi:hypothetical protein
LGSLQESGWVSLHANILRGLGKDGAGWWAILGLVWSSVVVADIVQKTVTDSVLNILVIDIIDSNPWNPFMWWGEGLSLEGNLVLKSLSISSLVAGHDIVKVGKLSLSGTLGSNSLIVGCGIELLDTVQEIEVLNWALNKVLGASLQVVVLALSGSVLAGELPSGGSLTLMGVSIWPEV